MYYNNWFDLEVIGSRQVKNLTKLQEFNYVSHIEYKKVYHEKMGIHREKTGNCLKTQVKVNAILFGYIGRQRYTTNYRYGN